MKDNYRKDTKRRDEANRSGTKGGNVIYLANKHF